MARPLYTNNAASSLAAGITSTQTTIQLSDGMGNLFPTPVGGDYFYATIVSVSLPVVEIVKCTARSGDYLTVVRGEEGTVPLPFNINDGVQLRITAAGMNFLTGQAVTSTEEETQTATQGQTVFTLVNFDYAPATNNLAVFVNGSKQVSGVNYSETSVNTVTFNTGLNAGDIVEFLVGVSVASGTLYANDVLYNEGGTGAVNRNVESKLQESISVLDFGAIGDYIVGGAINPAPTDNLIAFQNAFAASNKVIVPKGYYYLSDSLTVPRYGELIAQDIEATHLISGGGSAVLSQPLGSDVITVYGIRFDSTVKNAGIFFGNPGGSDYSTGNTFVNCVFGNSLSYTFIDKAQLTTFNRCSINAPIYQIDGNYLTVENCYFVWNDLPTAKSQIAGIDFGVAGTGYFNLAGIRVDSGQGQVINNSWFEHMPSCAIYMGAAVTGFSITNNKFERVSNGTASQSSIGLGWYVQVPDGSNILEGGIVSGNTVIGNVGIYSNGTTFTPDCLGFFGGPGALKCSFFGNSIGFFATASATVSGYKVSQYKPQVSDAYADGLYANTGAYSITPAPANGKIGAVKCLASTTQTIPNITWTKVVATTEVFDTNNWYTSAGGLSEYRPLVAGYYRVNAFVRLNAVPDGTSLGLALYKNGSVADTLDYQSAGATTNLAVSGSTSFYTPATPSSLDLYTVYIYQNSGGPLDTIALADAVRIEYELIGY